MPDPRKRPPGGDDRSKAEKSKDLDEELDESFPASDPPSATQPGGGVTGTEVKTADGKKR